jgi:hypothetical protein
MRKVLSMIKELRELTNSKKGSGASFVVREDELEMGTTETLRSWHLVSRREEMDKLLRECG